MQSNVKDSISFINDEYKKEWLEWVPGLEGKVRYCEGTYTLLGDGTKVVYDGATNYMGKVMPDGTFVFNQAGTEPGEYELTFLNAAKNN